jgi:hypothetical protein
VITPSAAALFLRQTSFADPRQSDPWRAIPVEIRRYWTELFAARKRGERPMNRYMETITAPALRALFEQAGPERPSTFLAP